MRLAVAIALVAALGSTEIERAQQTARSRESERAQFHRKYLFDLPGDTVTQIEVLTEFRRLVLITEQHLLNGDQMFSRGSREAEAAMAPTRGILTLKARLRFHPLNVYSDIPNFALGIGEPKPDAPLSAVYTQATGEHGPPYKSPSGKTVNTLTGAVLQADVETPRIGQTVRPIGVVFEGREVARVTVDFTRLD